MSILLVVARRRVSAFLMFIIGLSQLGHISSFIIHHPLGDTSSSSLNIITLSEADGKHKDGH